MTNSLLVLPCASCQHCALAVAAGLPAILKKPLIFPCDGLDFLPNVLCPLPVNVSAIGTKRTSLVALHMSAFDPKRTLGDQFSNAILHSLPNRPSFICVDLNHFFSPGMMT